ncbi:lasso peptide isopeptide bond-forming cyclase [Paenibacillus rigui]|uniref:asparagine synthase (glutamine-hydrolyzing) n=1 Tax=Paenibacillus rigui TaxID=554312 RepID=A0A229UPC6_9BACL|nr:lasso peptide isopeptide bond-forming cyclase [Paenibacillus rigui]OXM85210.1 asparagine synthetase B [Paenibacillus rigui]
MSAITGLYPLNQEPLQVEHGHKLMLGLQHYPCDDVRVWYTDSIFLGCHAQHITPESVHEQLPGYDSERQLAITADAMIDNRAELFRLLQIEHGRAKEMTDSELILLAYDKWDTNAPKYLIGDFAFMIWDERKRRLFGARDFSGSRTLYYTRNRERFAFCTVIEPLLSLPQASRKLNEQWLAQYLAISAMVDVVDVHSTVYADVEQLPPSHSVVVSDSGIELSRYCTITRGERLKLKSNEEYVEAFQDVFQQAVTSRLRTHRQVGAQLSGGLDSGSIVSFAARALRNDNRPLHTFSHVPSAGFKDFTSKRFMADESPFIRSTVQHVGGIKDHYLQFEDNNSFTEIDSFLHMMEMPYKFFENSFWLRGIFEKARDHGVGVLLNGGRGNLTISWGSAIDYYATLLKRMKWVRLKQELHQYSHNVGGSRLRNLPLIARTAFPVLDRLFPVGQSYQFPVIINPEFAKRTEVFDKLRAHGMDESGWYASSNAYDLRKKHFEELFHWNASNTLATKMSLRFGLWKRDPTNDLRVIRFCLSVPEEQYVQNGLDRALIRRSTERLLPDQVRLNQKVQGVQGADWVHRMMPYWRTFREELEQLSQDERTLQFLDGRVLRKALAKVNDGVTPELAVDPDYKVLMRSLIVHRFMKKVT